MDKNVEWFIEKKVQKTIDALEKNNMAGYYVNSNDEIIKVVESIIKKGDTVTCGGSMTLFETGIIDYLRKENYEFLDRYKDGITAEETKKIYRAAFSSDAYFTSTNAITTDGHLYNVDGNGNRVAAMMYGPDKVIVICGINKIVNSVEEAIQRNRTVSAPINAKRLDRKTPCATVGYCMDCKSPERICKQYSLIKSQSVKDRIHVIFVNENLGY
ncbi:MAG: lactate utilization protein [Sarcina sp.]